MSQRRTPLADAIDEFLADARVTPFTTPGHKRSPELADALLGLDLPLSAGADDLHQSRDLLGQAERLAAELWGADLCRFCVNGSTQGNEALALAVAGGPRRVVVSRNLRHKAPMTSYVAGLDVESIALDGLDEWLAGAKPSREMLDRVLRELSRHACPESLAALVYSGDNVNGAGYAGQPRSTAGRSVRRCPSD